ncbi:MAG: RluA family pseudouridine synthase [Eubacteriales bacterium]
MQKLTADENIAGERLDRAAASEMNISRSLAAKLISSGDIKVNNEVKKPSYVITERDIILIEMPESKPVDIVPQKMPLDIVFEDEYIIVINKPRNLVVHPSPGHEDMTLVNGLLFHCKDLAGIGAEKRPGIVHRIDKDTTGLLVIAKNDLAMESLSEQIADKSAKRKYKALVEGIVKEDGTVEASIGRSHNDRKKQAVITNGRYAKTNYRVQEQFENYTLLDVELDTGRTHQIRVHMAHINHPVVGDKLYGYKKQKFNLEGQMLHAYSLEFSHPKTKEIVNFSAPLPEDFTKVLEILQKKK